MIRLPAPVSMNGDALAAELAAAGVAHPAVLLVGDEIQVDAPDTARSTVERVVASHVPPVPPADPDDTLAASINAVDTTKVTDAATRAALEALKAALVGKGKPAAVSGRPTGR